MTEVLSDFLQSREENDTINIFPIHCLSFNTSFSAINCFGLHAAVCLCYFLNRMKCLKCPSILRLCLTVTLHSLRLSLTLSSYRAVNTVSFIKPVKRNTTFCCKIHTHNNSVRSQNELNVKYQTWWLM